MLPTIEVTINDGQISPIEPILAAFQGQAFLTLLTNTESKSAVNLSPSKTLDDICGLLTATHGVSLADMEIAISQQCQEE